PKLASLIDTSLVSIDLKFEKKNQGTAEIKDTQGKILYSVHFERLSRQSFYLSISSVIPELVELKLEPKSLGCFSSSSDPVVQVCSKENKFVIQASYKNRVPFFTLTGDKFAKEAPFILEEPVQLKLSEAIARALKKNFDSRIQFEHTLQARLAAKAAFLNLVPHLNLSNLLANFPLTVFSNLAVIGDIAPFLLPNRWFLAKEAGQLFQAEKYAEILMQADLATQVEGLAYTLLRDTDILDFTVIMAERVKDARDRIFALETNHQFPRGATDHLNSYSNELDMELDSLEEIIRLDKRAIAQALGYHNPDAIEDIIFDVETLPLDQAVDLDEKNLGGIALQRSFELQQIDALIVYSEYKKKEVYFSWLDPTTDPTIELGASLGPIIAAGNSRIRELKIKREQLQSILLQKMSAAVFQYNHAIDDNLMTAKGLLIQERREKRILELIFPHSDLNSPDVALVYQEYIRNWAEQKVAEAGFRIARANIDRMLLQGYYISLFLDYFGPQSLTPVANL
ncbi:MAG: hypothetical protein ABI041_17935, partial [Bdellovibrionia bacterium]